MREPLQQSRKADGPFGIRTGVWLIAFGSVLICVLTISLPRHHTSQLTPDVASKSLSHQESSTHESGFRRVARLEFTPATYESGASFDFDEAHLVMIEQMTQDRRTWWDIPE